MPHCVVFHQGRPSPQTELKMLLGEFLNILDININTIIYQVFQCNLNGLMGLFSLETKR